MDGIAPPASSPSRRRARLRAFLPHATYIPNKSGDNGTPKAASARSIVYRNANWRSSVRTFFDYPAQPAFDLAERRIQSRPPRIDNNIPLRTELLTMEPKSLSESPLDSISDHGFTDRTRHSKSQSRPLLAPPRLVTRPNLLIRPPQAESGEQRTRNPDALVIDEPKIGGAHDSRRRVSSLSQRERLFRR